MTRTSLRILAAATAIALATLACERAPSVTDRRSHTDARTVTVRRAVLHDVSRPLSALMPARTEPEPTCAGLERGCGTSPPDLDAEVVAQAPSSALPAPGMPLGAAIEQTSQGTRPAALLLESFDGQGYGTSGPHGTGRGNNPSDNSMAVGPNHVVETVNSRMAVYTKKGAVFDKSGAALFGPIETNVLFAGFGGECERSPNGDAVVRYDQLAQRWLYVMPLFRRAVEVPPGRTEAPYGMCYALSVGSNPLGPYYRYYFERELFPDYPRPAIWPDGYYIPTSTGDNLLPDGSLPEKHACVVERAKMLQGLPAREQCIIIKESNFLNNADIDGWGLPPNGAPNIMMASGGTQLRDDFDDDGIYYWKFHVDWETPANTRVIGPTKIPVEPYHYLCNGQLTRCVPQPDTDMRLDAQGDKIMQRLVYRNIGGRESIVAVHSVNTNAGAGGVRWYEFRLNANRDPVLHQQSTYAPDRFYRWMASPGIDRQGNIGIGYSFGGTPNYAGQRFAARLADDPLGLLTFHETVLVNGEGAQTNTLRWEDYTQLSMDPVDDCTFWYVGDYLKAGAPTYTTKIGAFRLPGCLRGTVSGTVYFDRNRNGVRDPNEPGLAGWQVQYAGVRGAQDRAAPPTGTLATDSIGDFTLSLPADPAYFDPTYNFTSRAPANASWVQIQNGVAYTSSGTLSMANRVYAVRLSDRDEVTRASFGNACSVRNTGGAPPGYWLGDEGRRTLAANDQQPVAPGGRGGRGGGRGGRGGAAGWRNLLNNSFLVNADGSRFTVPAGTFDDAYAAFRTWLSAAAATNIAHQTSSLLAATTLNVAYGAQNATITLLDPAAGDWPTIAALLERIRTFIEQNPNPTGAERNRAQGYNTLLEQLNSNVALITPSSPDRCPPPF